MGLGYSAFEVKYSYSNDFAGTGGEGQYVEAELSFDLPHDFGLGFHVGQSIFDDKVGIEDYTDYKAALSKSIRWLDVEVTYVDTNADELGAIATDRIVFAISKSF